MVSKHTEEKRLEFLDGLPVQMLPDQAGMLDVKAQLHAKDALSCQPQPPQGAEDPLFLNPRVPPSRILCDPISLPGKRL